MTIIKVLSVECDQNSACLAVITESQRFIFQAGEGIQRLASEHKVKIGKICSVYMLSDEISSVGGLPGLLLTLDDAGVKQVKVYGPPGTHDYMKATKIFMRQLGNYESISDTLDVVLHREKELTIHAIPLRNSANAKIRDICYVCETPIIVGKFDVEKAASLGIPKGPLFGKLKGGRAITLADGRVVSPDQVLGESIPSKYFALICDISRSPDEALRSSLYTHNYLNEFRITENHHTTTNNHDHKQLLYMVHFSDFATVTTIHYTDWLRSFGPTTTHLFLGRDCTPGHSSFLSSMLFNQKLFHICPRLFPKLQDNSDHNDTSKLTNHTLRYIPGRRLMKCHVLPHRRAGDIEYHASALPEIINEEQREAMPTLFGSEEVTAFVQELQDKHALSLSALAELQSAHATVTTTSQQQHHNHEIIFLGTGCAIPSKYRNVSSIAICVKQVNQPYVILLDAGEGTWYQLAHLSPPAALPFLDNAPPLVHWAFLLRVIWISHPHADHHLGLIRLLFERKQRYDEYCQCTPAFEISFQPVLLIAPMLIHHFLRENETLYPELPSLYRFIPTNYFDPKELCKPCITSNTTSVTVDVVTNIDNDNQSSSPSQQPQQKRKKINPALEVDELDSNTNATDATTGGTSSGSRSNSVKEHWKAQLTNVYHHPTWSSTLSYVTETLHSLGIQDLVNIPVIHCPQSYGLILTIQSDSDSVVPSQPFKFVYSGDTRPCDLLVEYGMHADVLIHEATFEDNKAIEAIQKRHSTISEAQGIAQAMQAKYLLLTHFSQRYHGIPMQFHPSYVPDDLTLGTTTVVQTDKQELPLLPPPIIAFDFMTIKCEDLPWLAKTTQLLAEIFPAETIAEESEEA